MNHRNIVNPVEVNGLVIEEDMWFYDFKDPALFDAAQKESLIIFLLPYIFSRRFAKLSLKTGSKVFRICKTKLICNIRNISHLLVKHLADMFLT